MAAWQAAALGAACLIGAHYLLLRAASGKIGDTLGALVLESAAVLGIAAAYALGLRGGGVATRAGVVFAVMSGLCISGASVLLFFALRRGGPVASTGTIVLGGGVALSALLAPFLFREPMTARRIVGVALGVLALLVLSTERSGQGAEIDDARGSPRADKEIP